MNTTIRDIILNIHWIWLRCGLLSTPIYLFIYLSTYLSRKLCCGRETAQYRCKIRCRVDCIAASRSSPCDSTAFLLLLILLLCAVGVSCRKRASRWAESTNVALEKSCRSTVGLVVTEFLMQGALGPVQLMVG